MSELDTLILEQEREMRLGSFQRPELFIAYSLDATPDERYWYAPLTGKRVDDGCAIHGNSESYVSSQGRPRCRACDRVTARRSYRRNREKILARKRASREEKRKGVSDRRVRP